MERKKKQFAVRVNLTAAASHVAEKILHKKNTTARGFSDPPPGKKKTKSENARTPSISKQFYITMSATAASTNANETPLPKPRRTRKVNIAEDNPYIPGDPLCPLRLVTYSTTEAPRPAVELPIDVESLRPLSDPEANRILVDLINNRRALRLAAAESTRPRASGSCMRCLATHRLCRTMSTDPLAACHDCIAAGVKCFYTAPRKRGPKVGKQQNKKKRKHADVSSGCSCCCTCKHKDGSGESAVAPQQE
jgi:hypothetical protein